MIRSSGLKTHTEQNKMSNSLTASVARLYRAGSEHSEQSRKLREAMDDLLRWISDNVPIYMDLPFDCVRFADGSFIRNHNSPSKRFECRRGDKHSNDILLKFSELIADGFLNELAANLETEAKSHRDTATTVNTFLINQQ